MREMSTISTQKRVCQPGYQERAEAESKQTRCLPRRSQPLANPSPSRVEDVSRQRRGKYRASHQNHQTSNKTINRAQDRRESSARK